MKVQCWSCKEPLELPEDIDQGLFQSTLVCQKCGKWTRVVIQNGKVKIYEPAAQSRL